MNPSLSVLKSGPNTDKHWSLSDEVVIGRDVNSIL